MNPSHPVLRPNPMSPQDHVGVGWTRVHQKPLVEEVHDQQEMTGVERVVEKEARELVEAVWM